MLLGGDGGGGGLLSLSPSCGAGRVFRVVLVVGVELLFSLSISHFLLFVALVGSFGW